MQILSWQQKTTSVIFFSHQHNQGTPVSLFLWCTAIWKPLYLHFRVRIKFICLKSSIDASNNHVADRRDTRWIIWGCIATVGYIKRKINSVLFEYCIKKYFSLKLPKVEGNHISLLDSRKKEIEKKSCFIVHGAGRPLMGTTMFASHDQPCYRK